MTEDVRTAEKRRVRRGEQGEHEVGRDYNSTRGQCRLSGAWVILPTFSIGVSMSVSVIIFRIDVNGH
jgi:hypothetical protein